MKKRKIFSVAAAVVLAFGIMSTSAAAESSYCQFIVGGKQCGYPVSLRFTGHDDYQKASHEYGGFLGINTQTCNYTYRHGYYNEECSQGHVRGVRKVRVEYGHTCGK